MNRKIMQMMGGNPGSMSALVQLDEAGHSDVIDRLDEIGITGGDIYILQKDICHRDVEAFAHLVMNSDADKLKDAASRQDRSGREILKDEYEAAKAHVEGAAA